VVRYRTRTEKFTRLTWKTWRKFTTRISDSESGSPRICVDYRLEDSAGGGRSVRRQPIGRGRSVSSGGEEERFGLGIPLGCQAQARTPHAGSERTRARCLNDARSKSRRTLLSSACRYKAYILGDFRQFQLPFHKCRQPTCCAIYVGSTRSAKPERPDEAFFASPLGHLHRGRC
jgi:hypothetical protein